MSFHGKVDGLERMQTAARCIHRRTSRQASSSILPSLLIGTLLQKALPGSQNHLRNSAIESIASNWMQTDPAAAKEWLMTSGLPDDRIQALLKPPTDQGTSVPMPTLPRHGFNNVVYQ